MSEKIYKIFNEQEVSSFISKGTDPESGSTIFTQEFHTKPLSKIEAELVSNTDTLIGIMDGTITDDAEYFLDEHRRFNGPVDAAIYLDKSSRPVRALIKELWPIFSDGKLPTASFLNIDKENYILDMGYSRAEYRSGRYINPDELTLDKLDDGWRKEATARIRALYVKNPKDVERAETLLDEVESGARDPLELGEIWEFQTHLDDLHVAVVDEVKSSKATLAIADKLLQEAFPSAKIEPMFWSTPHTMIYDFYDKSSGEVVQKIADTEKPIWYDSSTSQGRGGIEGKNPEWSAKSKKAKQRIGRYVLSVPYTAMNDTPDVKGGEVRDDIATLRERFEQGKINFMPSTGLSIEDAKTRIEKHYKMPFDGWLRKKRDQ